MRPDGSGQRILARRPAGGDKRTSWSPDGRFVAFDSWRYTPPRREFDIFVVDADGKRARRVTRHPARELAPSWSPEGRRIAFTRKRAGGNLEDAFVVRADGRRLRRVATVLGPGIAWSPDGRQLLVAAPRGLTAVRLDGTAVRRYGFIGISAGAWSAAGIVYTSSNDDIWRMDADGSNRRRLTTSKAADFDASWAPSGDQIVFTSERDGNKEVYVMDADGSNQRNLTRSAGEEWAGAWQPLPR
jgi:TolB protein